MNRFITYFNIVGILALAGIAVWQWNVENRLRHGRDAFRVLGEKTGKELRETQGALADAKSSIEEFRKRVEVLEDDNAKLTKDLRTAEKRAAQLAGDVARLEKAVAAWKEAVAERDTAIAKLNEAVKEQVAARNDAVSRYNDVVEKYNVLAKRTTEAEKLVLAARAERDKALEQLKAALAVNES